MLPPGITTWLLFIGLHFLWLSVLLLLVLPLCSMTTLCWHLLMHYWRRLARVASWKLLVCKIAFLRSKSLWFRPAFPSYAGLGWPSPSWKPRLRYGGLLALKPQQLRHPSCHALQLRWILGCKNLGPDLREILRWSTPLLQFYYPLFLDGELLQLTLYVFQIVLLLLGRLGFQKGSAKEL